MAIIKDIKLKNKIVRLLKQEIKESYKCYAPEQPDKDDFHWEMEKALKKLEAYNYKSSIKDIKRVAMIHGRTEEYLSRESVDWINKGFMPFIFENPVAGLNVTKYDYTVAFFKI